MELRCARAAPFLTRLMMGRSLLCQRCQSSLHSHRKSTVTASSTSSICGRVQQKERKNYALRRELRKGMVCR